MIVHAALVNVKDNQGHTPLHYAAYHGHESCVLALIDDVDWKADEENAFGPLHGAA
jgi:ankyrin repeat protein